MTIQNQDYLKKYDRVTKALTTMNDLMDRKATSIDADIYPIIEELEAAHKTFVYQVKKIWNIDQD
jgi:hypothetical protein